MKRTLVILLVIVLLISVCFLPHRQTEDFGGFNIDLSNTCYVTGCDGQLKTITAGQTVCGEGHKLFRCDRGTSTGGSIAIGNAVNTGQTCYDCGGPPPPPPPPPAPVNCQLSAWSTCSAPCGGGTQTRTVVSQPQYGGVPCSDFTLEQACNTQPCPVDCVVSSWGPCSANCGDGTQTRTIVTQPAGGGAACPELERACFIRACDAPAPAPTSGSAPASGTGSAPAPASGTSSTPAPAPTPAPVTSETTTKTAGFFEKNKKNLIIGGSAGGAVLVLIIIIAAVASAKKKKAGAV